MHTFEDKLVMEKIFIPSTATRESNAHRKLFLWQIVSYFCLENDRILLTSMGQMQNNILILNFPENELFAMLVLFDKFFNSVLWAALAIELHSRNSLKVIKTGIFSHLEKL